VTYTVYTATFVALTMTMSASGIESASAARCNSDSVTVDPAISPPKTSEASNKVEGYCNQPAVQTMLSDLCAEQLEKVRKECEKKCAVNHKLTEDEKPDKDLCFRDKSKSMTSSSSNCTQTYTYLEDLKTVKSTVASLFCSASITCVCDP
jgi:hypothetical protein